MFTTYMLVNKVFNHKKNLSESRIPNNTDSDQTAPEGAVWSGSSFFGKVDLLGN